MGKSREKYAHRITAETLHLRPEPGHGLSCLCALQRQRRKTLGWSSAYLPHERSVHHRLFLGWCVREEWDRSQLPHPSSLPLEAQVHVEAIQKAEFAEGAGGQLYGLLKRAEKEGNT